MRWNLLTGYEGKRIHLNVNGHKVEGTVTIQWEYDDFPTIGDDFDFGDQKDNEDYLKRFERGELSNVIVSVIVRAEGLEGIDTLGGCHVSNRDFVKDVIDLVTDHAMIDNASRELTQNIIDTAIRLQKYAKGA